jgi:hypothetical protein
LCGAAQLLSLGIGNTTLMKRRTFYLFAIVVLMSGAAFARYGLWPDKARPRLSLPDAYGCATAGLGAATNRFYCISAGCLISQSPDGEWLFVFSNTNGVYKSVTVFFDKSTKVRDGIQHFY